ncbi:MAG: WD40 repeat domain-containing protein [Planctomycetia bacterium]|nr:WD40 repeat domain-containing protein [Planctomycetia bacterium]
MSDESKPTRKLRIPEHRPDEETTWWVVGRDTKSTSARRQAEKRRRWQLCYLILMFSAFGLAFMALCLFLMYYFLVPDSVDFFTPKATPVLQCEQVHQGTIRDLAFSPGGKYLLSGSEDKTAILWSTETGRMLRRLEGHKDMVTSVALASNRLEGEDVDDWGHLVAVTGSKDMYAIVWNLLSEPPVAMFRLGERLSLDEGISESLSEDEELNDLLAPVPANGHTKGIEAVAISPTGQYALTGGNDDRAILWNVMTGSRYSTLERHADAVTAVGFNPNGRFYATAGEDCKVFLWNMKDDSLFHTLSGHSGTVTSLSFSANGRSVLSGSRDHTAILWDVISGNQLQKLFTLTEIRDVALSAQETYALTNMSERTAVLWKTQSGEKLFQFVSPSPIIALAMSPVTDERGIPVLVAIANSDNQIILYSTRSENKGNQTF